VAISIIALQPVACNIEELYSSQAYLKIRIGSALLWMVTCAGLRCVISTGSEGALDVGESAAVVSGSLREFKVGASSARFELMMDLLLSKSITSL
jgi:hypothetical protein